MDMDQDEHEHEHSGDDGSDPETASTRAGKRVAELQQVEEACPLTLSPSRAIPTDEMHTHTQNVAALLHFAGCTLASLHPDPLSSFTVREIATDDTDDDDDDGEQQESSHGRDKKPATTPKPDHQQDQDEAKLQEFAKYAEGYFATLNVCAPRAYNGPSLSLLVSLARADLLKSPGTTNNTGRPTRAADFDSASTSCADLCARVDRPKLWLAARVPGSNLCPFGSEEYRSAGRTGRSRV
jgi:hypothetical protein